MLCPWLFLRIMKAKNPTQYLNIGQKKWWTIPKHAVLHLTLCTGIAISFMVFNSPIVEWNASLPIDSWGILGKWMKEQEIHIKKLTEAMIQMDKLADLGLVIVCMAIVPAITEEFLFRGLLQGMVITHYKECACRNMAHGFVIRAFSPAILWNNSTMPHGRIIWVLTALFPKLMDAYMGTFCQ